MTTLLAAALALAADWCIGHRTGRTLRRASAQVEAIIRPFPDPAPMPDWERLDEKARIDDAIYEIERHWNEDAA